MAEDLHKLLQTNMIKLRDIHRNYDTDKGTSHSYIDLYDELFEPFQNEPINLCEVGARVCGGLKMFNEYFANATLYGVDNWQEPNGNIEPDNLSNIYVSGFYGARIHVSDLQRDIADNYPRIKLVTCNSTRQDQVMANFGNLKFRAIIDDGDHRFFIQFETFKNFISLLDDNGIYVVEDVADPDKFVLNNMIKEYLAANNLNRTTEIREFRKNGLGDDIVIIIR